MESFDGFLFFNVAGSVFDFNGLLFVAVALLIAFKGATPRLLRYLLLLLIIASVEVDVVNAGALVGAFKLIVVVVIIIIIFFFFASWFACVCVCFSLSRA